MSELKRYLPSKQEAKDYTLFLDRDGVINQYIKNDYAKKPSDFVIAEGVIKAISQLQQLFSRIVIITNQQGVGKKVMSETDLEDVHLKLYDTLRANGIKWFDGTFFAPYLKTENHNWRKPSIGMLQKAKTYFPDIDWAKSVFVGDSPGDMELADNLGLIKVKIANPAFTFDNQDFEFNSLVEFVDCMS